MSRTIVSALVAAAPRALLTLALSSPLVASSAWAGGGHGKPEVPGFYKTDLCVASITEDTNLVTFLPANLANPNAGVSYAFKKLPDCKVGDLVRLRANPDKSTGGPAVHVREAGSAKCSRWVKKQ